MIAAMLVLEPIFEADFPPEQYAYRPRRNAQQAVVCVRFNLSTSSVVSCHVPKMSWRMPMLSSGSEAVSKLAVRRAAHRARLLASFRSSVSKPSVKEP
jgi:RNA-directed DNA polymerase